MSKTPILILTRPLPAARRVLENVEETFGQPVPHVFSPIIQIEAFSAWPTLPCGVEAILTSEHAVQGDLKGIIAHCVGARTAEAAKARGAKVLTTSMNAEELLSALKARNADYVHLCGSHKAVDITAHLTALGHSCRDHQVYAQVTQPLSERARMALEGEDPALLPLFSPRSARLVGEGIVKPGAQLHVIGMSDAIANAWYDTTGTPAMVVEAPTGDAMVRGIVAALRSHTA